jgi:hypothetical protein
MQIYQNEGRAPLAERAVSLRALNSQPSTLNSLAERAVLVPDRTMTPSITRPLAALAHPDCCSPGPDPLMVFQTAHVQFEIRNVQFEKGC